MFFIVIIRIIITTCGGNLTINRNTKTVYLPEIIKYYWKDFGGSRKSVVQTVQTLVANPLAADIAYMLKDNDKPRVVVIPFDWTFCIEYE